jgi:predicted dehydrogenase
MNELQLGMHGFGYIGRIHTLSLATCKMLPQLNPHIHWKRCFVRDVNSDAYVLASQVFEEVVVDDGGPLDLRGLDAIDITTPNDLHARVALQASEEGVHIYCEKPLSASLEESKTMRDAVEKSGVIHQVALCSRVLPAVEQAHALLQSGILGKVLTFRATKLHGGYLDTRRLMTWRLQRSRAGAGAVMDLGVHVIDLVLFLLGSIQDVQAMLKTHIRDRMDAFGENHPVDVDDWAHLRLTMENGTVGTLEVSRVHYGQEESTLTIVCENGTLGLDFESPEGLRVALLPPLVQPKTNLMLTKYRIPEKYSTDGFLSSHATNLLTFLDRVRGVEVDYPLPTFRDAWMSEVVVHEAVNKP